ncbi:TPA: CAP domain-containing protein [Candidatus Berkelbacteria bacterium]|uniref:SCP domain-containing protein n=1 Tax=Berkelbacteria bacterium GW2011_GWE1_39_12 TaxID=1618337 RepID=A0A0G4B3G7_9BACT|nr:MAG: hypothetical protein UT28_C0001G0586 [Berkelbacteria bacterium GW2011_GWE1_39_12]HBO60980.1 CAP domain-containing protein [Candidatus Berkelbacteria bacterium]
MGKNFKKLLIGAILIILFVGPIKFANAAVSSNSLTNLVNASRSQEGLSPLSNNAKLADAALKKAQDMFDNQYFSHNSPEGKTPWDFFKVSDYDYVYAGENLAIGYTDSNELHDAWMNSPTHRENIMNPNYREIGIAFLSGEYNGENTTIVVQTFGSMSAIQPASQLKTVSASEINKESGAVNSFEILNDGTSFTPTKIFQNDSVDFKVAIKGDAKDVYIMVGDQKIDLKNILLLADGSVKNLSKTVKIENAGKLNVALTVTDHNNEQEVKDLGILEVNSVVVANAGTNRSITAATFNNIIDHLSLYLSGTFFLILMIALYFLFVRQRYGKFI